jgi:DNA-binding FadR family transcriptional regulator
MVSGQLLRRIAFGEFPPGSRLPIEPQLALQFKVSRTVIRESVRALEDKGVLIAQQGRGTVVSDRNQWSPFDPLIIGVRLETEPTTKLFSDLAEMRMTIECQLAEWAALNASAEARAELQRLVEEQAQLTVVDPVYTELDIQFHQRIAEASENEIGRGIMTSLSPAFQAMRRLTNEIPGATEHTHDLHRRILDCILAGDGPGAKKAMAQHLGWSREHFLSLKHQ